jgi:predicted transcriptional regulator
MSEPDPNDIFATSYDIHLYFVPMLTGHKTVAYKKVMRKVREDTNPELYPHILFYKGQLNTYKDALKLEDKDVPYFFILDDNGQIVWKTSGSYSTSKMQEIIDQLDEALGGW